MNTLAHHNDSTRSQEYHLQTIVDLKAKILELEAKLLQMTEKATNADEELQYFKANLENKLQMQINLPIPKPTVPDILGSIIDKFLTRSKCATDEQKR
jgi:hypothetical protein